MTLIGVEKVGCEGYPGRTRRSKALAVTNVVPAANCCKVCRWAVA